MPIYIDSWNLQGNRFAVERFNYNSFLEYDPLRPPQAQNPSDIVFLQETDDRKDWYAQNADPVNPSRYALSDMIVQPIECGPFRGINHIWYGPKEGKRCSMITLWRNDRFSFLYTRFIDPGIKYNFKRRPLCCTVLQELTSKRTALYCNVHLVSGSNVEAAQQLSYFLSALQVEILSIGNKIYNDYGIMLCSIVIGGDFNIDLRTAYAEFEKFCKDYGYTISRTATVTQTSGGELDFFLTRSLGTDAKTINWEIDHNRTTFLRADVRTSDHKMIRLIGTP